MAIHTYHINRGERGEFFADVRRNGETVYEISEFEIIEDGFMFDHNDTAGLREHLLSLGVFDPNDSIGTEAEAEAEARSNVLRADSRGNMLFPNGDPMMHRYMAGDYDDIKATDTNLSHLCRALYDARECGGVPDVSVFILPNGEEFNVDTFKPVREIDPYDAEREYEDE
jgi:hypothetical protein